MRSREDTWLLILLLVILLVPVILRLMRAKRLSFPEPFSQDVSQTYPEPVRKSAVAGTFYPADPQELRSLLSDLVGQAESIKVEGKCRILIVPHAGLTFSGRTAAWGFKQVEGGGYSRIIIIGSSHRALFNHAAVFAQGTWETPLGKVAIDELAATSFLDEGQKIIADTDPHNQEHSLEVELIFLQEVLENFKVVPILVSQPSEELVEQLAQKISQQLDNQTLLVVSTDLSHYPSWEMANKVDDQTIKAILSGKKEVLEKTIPALEAEDYQNLETAACGYQALRVALRTAEILEITDFKKIKYENSGDVSGDKSRVVGYGAIGAWGGKVVQSARLFDQAAEEEALTIARQTLEEYLKDKKISSLTPKSQVLNRPLGAFVTLRKNGNLRGCIGEFEPSDPLFQVIQRKAIAAATQDSRFSPVQFQELDQIEIEISVLSPRREIKSWQDIQLGKHGVVVQKGIRAGTFLPQVATETGWSLKEFLSQLCSQKAGLPKDCYQDSSVTLSIFEAQVFHE
jgi:AmmeMemoRadiSam system protein B/AmmeMemoRadiSam system protein A